MLPQNDFLVQHEFLDYKLQGLKVEVDQRRLLHRAGMVRRPWVTCQICRTLWQLGRLMVTAGQRLERRYAVPSLSHG
jgi:hypothetical protein